jgi:hypothetical protein
MRLLSRLLGWLPIINATRTRREREAVELVATLDFLETMIAHPEETVAEINRLGEVIREIMAGALGEDDDEPAA